MEEKHPSSRQNGEQQQAEQYQTWRQKIKRYQVAIGVVAIVLVAVVALIAGGYIFHWSWTGLNGGYSKITITSSIKGGTKADEQLSAKTLWDWMQLLFIPAVLVVGGFLFNLTISRNEQKATKQRDKTERDIALGNQQEAALQAYINAISELLLEKKLRESQPGDEVQNIARVRTLTALRGLDSVRKGSVLQFLQESGLIKRFDPNPIIVLSNAPDWVGLRVADLSWANLQGADLHDADLSGTNLHFADLCQAQLPNADLHLADLRDAKLIGAYLSLADLSGADLTSANLMGANLTSTKLIEADLIGADLTKANLRGATGTTTEQLEKAKSLQGATMPDGRVHP